MKSFNRISILAFLLLLGIGLSACKSSPEDTDETSVVETDSEQETEQRVEKGTDNQGDARSGEAEMPTLPEGHARVDIRRGALLLDGEQVATLDGIEVPAAAKEGGESGLVVTPLSSALGTSYTESESARLEHVQIVASPEIGYRTVVEVMFTAARMGVGDFSFALGAPVRPGPMEITEKVDLQLPKISTNALGASGDQEKRLDLSVAVVANGFRVGAFGVPRPPIDGCDEEGPNVCLRDQATDTAALFADARAAYASGEAERGHELLEKAAQSYDFAGLYSVLVELDKQRPDEDTIKIAADADIPVLLVFELMEHASIRLPNDSYESAESYRAARAEAGADAERLFGDPVLAIVQ